MASTKLMETKGGKRFFQICVSRGYGKAPYKKRWYWPDGWSKRAVERELPKVAAEFERACSAGEVLNRAQAKEKAANEAAEAAMIRTFKEYGEAVFMPMKRTNCSENTRVYYQSALNNHLYPVFGNLRLPDITSSQISAYFLKLRESNLSYSTIIGIYVTCSQLFKHAYFDETIFHNPMDKVQRPRRRKDELKKDVEAFTADELKFIISLLAAESLKWQCFTRLLIDTGIRRGEACALRWEDIDFKENSALIHANLGYTPDKGVYLDATKTGRERIVYFSSDAASLLKQYKTEQAAATSRRATRLSKETNLLPLEKITIPEYIFTERGSNAPMTPDAVNRFFQRFSKRHGIEIHAHKLRHSFASLAILNGSDIASVSEVLGHADKATTLRVYSHADEESKRRAANIVANAIKHA
ncbi:MAG: site-specific integrase [Oscillospiraceae bacterium]|nr:site-specific integrase [Oscillospiraceae bacterium]